MGIFILFDTKKVRISFIFNYIYMKGKTMFIDKEDENIFSKIAKEATRSAGLKLGESVSSSYATKEDTARVKFGLNKLGYYDEPEKTGMNTIPDEQMFDGIKDFQKDNGLQVDGYLKPFGETINKINEGLKNNQNIDSAWGDKTKAILDDYLDNYDNYPGKTRSGIKAPYNDMKRNFDTMKNLGLIGGDKFFHCKANYEASKRGTWGDAVSKVISTTKEIKDVFEYGLQDSMYDWEANQKGWYGAKNNLSLKESCPTDPKKYIQ